MTSPISFQTRRAAFSEESTHLMLHALQVLHDLCENTEDDHPAGETALLAEHAFTALEAAAIAFTGLKTAGLDDDVCACLKAIVLRAMKTLSQQFIHSHMSDENRDQHTHTLTHRRSVVVFISTPDIVRLDVIPVVERSWD